MRDPLVSVIIIFLDEERFLGEAVESVFAQSYADWELLLCDDGSTDGSSALARDYARRHPARVRYLEHAGHENLGMSATRNLGLHDARGELVAFLDSDDVWLPQKLERQVEALQAHPEAQMTWARTLWWFGWTGRAEDEALNYENQIPSWPGRVLEGPTALSRILRDPTLSPCTGSIVARKAAVMEVGGFEEEYTGLFEDWVFLSKFLLVHPVVLTDECLDRYRQHPDSCCAVAERIEGLTRGRQGEYLAWLRRYIEDRPVGPVLRWDVTRELWCHRFPFLEHVREARSILYGGIVMGTLAVGRILLPRALRKRLWARWITP